MLATKRRLELDETNWIMDCKKTHVEIAKSITSLLTICAFIEPIFSDY